MYYCALHLGVLEHTPGCLFIVQFGASWNVFSENVLLIKKIYMIIKVIKTWTPAWGQSWPLPPPVKNPRFFLRGAFFFTWGLLCQFFATFSSCAWGGGLFGLASPPYENFCRRPCSGIVGNLSYGTLSWHYGHISYR